MVALTVTKSPPVSPINAPQKEKKKRVRYVIPTYKKSDKIIQNILSYKDNPKHIFRYKALDRIYQEIAKEVLQGQNLLPFDGIVLKRDCLNLHINVYKKEKYKWLDRKNKLWKEFMVDNFTIISAEIQGTECLPVGERLKIHIELLRQLRQGVKLKKAIKIARKAGK